MKHESLDAALTAALADIQAEFAGSAMVDMNISDKALPIMKRILMTHLNTESAPPAVEGRKYKAHLGKLFYGDDLLAQFYAHVGGHIQSDLQASSQCAAYLNCQSPEHTRVRELEAEQAGVNIGLRTLASQVHSRRNADPAATNIELVKFIHVGLLESSQPSKPETGKGELPYVQKFPFNSVMGHLEQKEKPTAGEALGTDSAGL